MALKKKLKLPQLKVGTIDDEKSTSATNKVNLNTGSAGISTYNEQPKMYDLYANAAANRAAQPAATQQPQTSGMTSKPPGMPESDWQKYQASQNLEPVVNTTMDDYLKHYEELETEPEYESNKIADEPIEDENVIDVNKSLDDLAKNAKMAIKNNSTKTPTSSENKSVGSQVVNPVNATSERETTTEKEESQPIDTKSIWDTYRTQLEQSKVNQKAELAAINQKANSYVNTYLKALGLSGTSAGASQIAENSANLMNAYSQVNRNAQNQENYYNEQEYNENEARRLEAKSDAEKAQTRADKLAEQEATAKANAQATNSSRLENAYTNALNNGASARQLNEMLNNANPNDLAEGTIDYLRSLGGDALDWNNDKELTLSDLYEKVASTNFNYLKDIYNQLNNAKTDKEFYSLMDKYQDQLSERAIADKINKNAEEYDKAAKTVVSYTSQKMSESEYNEFVNTPEYKEAIKRAGLPKIIYVVGMNTKGQEIDRDNIPYSVYKDDNALGKTNKEKIKKALEEVIKEKYTL